MAKARSAMFERLHHIAYRCRDAQETVDFYTKVIGLKFAASIMPDEGYRPYGEPVDSIHIFFELGDGSYLAFFDVASSPPEQADQNTPWWVKHLAFEVPDMAALLEGKRRLEAAGYEVLGPKDHDFCQSIYFFDPNGHRLEMTVRSEAEGELDKMARQAPVLLKEWNARKERKYGKPAAAE
jgi:catechol 2,3-dioxygenase-like lactoylglutathione lyase family enzyme